MLQIILINLSCETDWTLNCLTSQFKFTKIRYQLNNYY